VFNDHCLHRHKSRLKQPKNIYIFIYRRVIVTSKSDPFNKQAESKQGLIRVKPLAMALLSVKTWSFWGGYAGVPFFKTHTKIFRTGLYRTEGQPKDSYFFEPKGERWHRLGNQLELPQYRMSSSHWGHKTTFGSPAAWADYGAHNQLLKDAERAFASLALGMGHEAPL
jgi:hypothetical protein